MYNGQVNSNIGNGQSSHYLNEGPAEREHQGWHNRGDSQLSDANSRGFQQSHGFDEVHEQEWTENRPQSNTIRDGQYRRRRQVSQTHSYHPSEAKLPPFSGKEEWKVWLNRFEAVAKGRNWDDEVKLDNLLPRLQGRAGDFVYNQLSEDTLSCYPELIKELNSRFRVVETDRKNICGKVQSENTKTK